MNRTATCLTGILFCAALACTGCGRSVVSNPSGLKDGVYTGTYESDGDHPSTMQVKVEIRGEKFTRVEAVEYDDKGNPKDESYCKGAGDQTYRKAQQAVAGIRAYPERLLETQDLRKVDAVSGATVSHKAFREAIKDALAKAR